MFRFSVVLIGAFLCTECESSEFAVEVLEYLPAPGQWVNNPDFNDPNKAVGAPVGLDVDEPDNTSVVSLGSFGGRIVLKFDHRVMDDPRNPMGLDAIVFGNAFWKLANPYWRWQEPGNIEISADVNANGIADDPWYLIPGSHSDFGSLCWTSVTYHRTDANFPPEDKAAYPSPTYFPSYPDVITFQHYLLPDHIVGDYENPNEGSSELETVWGYANLSPTLPDPIGDGSIYLIPDNPYTVGLISESGGGDSFDIADAIDASTGQPADLGGFDFIRITSGSDFYYSVPFFFDISTEVDAVSDVQVFGEVRGFWRLDEDNPSQVDSSGYSNTGIVSGATYTSAGRTGGAYIFDCIDDHISIGEHFTLDLVDEITVEAWIKLTQLPSTKAEPTKDATILAKGSAGSEIEINYELVIGADDQLRFRFYDGTWSDVVADGPFDILDVGLWRHVAFTYSRDSGIGKLFIDGECRGEGTFSGKLPMNESELVIGARLNGSGTESHFPGVIDEIKVECVERNASGIYGRYWGVDGDIDGDGLPDFWESTYLGGTGAEPGDDDDVDGETNQEEYGAGTRPDDSNSYFAFSAIDTTASGVDVSFETVRGWEYAICCCDDISAGVWNILGTMTGNGSTMSYLDEGDTEQSIPNPLSASVSERYYKVSAE